MRAIYVCEHCGWSGEYLPFAQEHEKNCRVANCEHLWVYEMAENKFTGGGWLSRTCTRCGKESGSVEITQEMCADIFKGARK